MFDRSLIAVIAVVVALGATTADSLTAEYQMIHAVNQADQARGGEPRPDPAVVQPFPGAEIPATILPSKVIGRWGWASFHQPEDRARTEASARDQCTNLPYSIDQGPKGGVMMHLPDQIEKVELRLKGGPGGRNFIGPVGQPGGASRDQEFLSPMAA